MSFETPRRRPPTKSGTVSRSWTEWTQQLQAYVAWVNSQLRKKPGTKEVKDLRRELQDGTVLVELIEIVANEQIPGTHPNPTNSLEMKENIDRVLQFMRSRQIKMHQIRTNDIMEGNMKSIMRLILALAAYFKPSSVKQSSNQQTRVNRSLGIAQEAASALASIKQDADSIKRKMHRPANLDGSGPPETQSHKQQSNRVLSYDQLSPHISLQQTHSPSRRRTRSNANSPSHNSFRSTSSKSSLDSSSDDLERFSAIIDDVEESHTDLLDETKTARNLLIDLQNVLLNGDEQNESLEITENTPSHEQLSIYQSRLQQSEETNNLLREELSRIKQECMQLQGMKHGLHQRLTEQQQEILEMKAQALRARLDRDDEEVESLRDDLTEKTTMLNRLHSDLERKTNQLKNLEQELKSSINHRDDIVSSLQSQITELKSQSSSRVIPVQKSVAEKINFKPFENIDLQGVNDPALLSDLQSVQDILIELTTSCSLQHISLIDKTITKLVNQVKTVSSHKPTAEVKGHRNLTKRPVRLETTKLLCFSSKSVTPSMKSVQKKIGEVTLYDFKTTFSQTLTNGAQMKYSFKTLDPEFGTVKEELTNDHDILPGWEGKIIGWIEEDYL